MRLRDVMEPMRHAPCTADAYGSVAAAVASMTAAGRSACVILDGDIPVGVLSAADLLRCTRGNNLFLDTPIRQVMTQSPLLAGVDDPALETVRDMIRRGVHHLPVMDGATVAGVLQLSDIAAAVIDALHDELLTLEGYIADMHAARED